MGTARLDDEEGPKKKSIHYMRTSGEAYMSPQALAYDVYRCPAKIDEAEMHARANAFALPEKDSKNSCPCCRRVCEVRPFTLLSTANSISDVCPTVAVYFYFVWFAIIVLLLVFALNSIVLLVYQPEFRNCFFTDCPEDALLVMQMYQAAPSIRVLAFVCLAAMIASRHIFYYFVRKRYITAEMVRVSANDFSLLLHVPDYRTECQIMEDLQEIIANHNLSCTVIKVNKVYNLRKYIGLLRDVSEKDQALRRMQNAGQQDTIPYRKHLDDKGFALESLELASNHLQTLHGEVENFANVAFVTFKNNYDCLTMSLLLQRRLNVSLAAAREYCTEEADEPENYLWQNFGTRIGQKVYMRLSTLLASLLCWAATFTLLTLFKYGVSINASLKNAPPVLVNFGCYIIITVAHILFGYVLGFLTERERFVQLSRQLTSISWKAFLVSFVNTAISITVSCWVNSGKEMVQAIWNSGGMVPTAMLVMTFDVAYNTFVAICGPSVLHAAFKRRSLVTRVQKEGAANKVMQIDLNKALEPQQFTVSGHYTALFYVLSMSFFFHHVAPYAALIGVGTLLVKLAVTRYILFYRSARPHNFSFEFTHNMFVMLDFCLLIYAASVVFFQSIFLNAEPWFKTLMIVTGCVNFLYGVLVLYSKTVKAEAGGQELLFEKCSPKLMTDYDRENPLTATRALKAWVDGIDLTTADKTTLQVVQLNTAAQPKIGLAAQNYINRANLAKDTHTKPPRIDTMSEFNNAQATKGSIEPQNSSAVVKGSLRMVAQQNSAQLSQAAFAGSISELDGQRRQVPQSLR